MQNKLILLTLIATLTGCGTPQIWYQPGKTAAETQRDFGTCKVEAVRSADPHGLTGLASLGGLGGYLGAGAARDSAIASFMDGCMLSKGYSLVKRNTIPDGANYPKK